MTHRLIAVCIVTAVTCLCSCESQTEVQLRKFYRENEMLKHEVSTQNEKVALLEGQNQEQLKEIGALKSEIENHSCPPVETAKSDEAVSTEEPNQIEAIKEEARRVVNNLRNDIEERDDRIAQLEDRVSYLENQSRSRTQRAPTPQRRLSTSSGLSKGAGTTRLSGARHQGGIHLEGKSCTIVGHGCELRRRADLP